MPHYEIKRQLHTWDGGPLAAYVALLSEGLHYMVNFKKSALGAVTQSRTALAVVAATLLVGGSITEASAKSRHHRNHSHHAGQATQSDWRNANASMGST